MSGCGEWAFVMVGGFLAFLAVPILFWLQLQLGELYVVQQEMSGLIALVLLAICPSLLAIVLFALEHRSAKIE